MIRKFSTDAHGVEDETPGRDARSAENGGHWIIFIRKAEPGRKGQILQEMRTHLLQAQ